MPRGSGDRETVHVTLGACSGSPGRLMTTTAFFVDLYAWGAAAKVQAAFRQVRQQIKDHNDEGGDVEAWRVGVPDLSVSVIPGAGKKDVIRTLPLVVNARTMSEVTDVLWSDTFIKQGGTMAFVALDITDPTPVFGWINRDGVVLKQGWELTTRLARDKHGNVKLSGPHGADGISDRLFEAFLALPAVRDHLAVPALALAG